MIRFTNPLNPYDHDEGPLNDSSEDEAAWDALTEEERQARVARWTAPVTEKEQRIIDRAKERERQQSVDFQREMNQRIFWG